MEDNGGFHEKILYEWGIFHCHACFPKGIWGSLSHESWLAFCWPKMCRSISARCSQGRNVLGVLSGVRWDSCYCGWLWRQNCQGNEAILGSSDWCDQISPKVLVLRWLARNWRWWGLQVTTSGGPVASAGILSTWIWGGPKDDICYQGQWFPGASRVASLASKSQHQRCRWLHAFALCGCKWTH